MPSLPATLWMTHLILSDTISKNANRETEGPQILNISNCPALLYTRNTHTPQYPLSPWSNQYPSMISLVQYIHQNQSQIHILIQS